MSCYAVIDTNVLVSALMSRCRESATVQLMERMMLGEIVPIYNDDIIQEYWEVLKREKFNFSESVIRHVMETIVKFGVSVEPKPTGEQLPDMKDLPFYEVVMEKQSDNAYLVTGNLKHFPRRTYIVTARQMLDIIDGKEKISI